jgi:hypothetical protein
MGSTGRRTTGQWRWNLNSMIRKLSLLASMVMMYKNLVAKACLPEDERMSPVVLAFGGAEGGISTGESHREMPAPHCIAVLALAYFKEEGLPPTLDRIPLEYFVDAQPRSAWTYRGKDVPALSIDNSPSVPQVKRFENALDAVVNRDDYRIKLERIDGPVFLISALNEEIWPSTGMSNSIVEQFKDTL